MSEKEDVRRIVARASETIEAALRDRKERLAAPPKPKAEYKPLSEVAQLERQIYLANLALNKYEVRFEDGDDFTPEEERVFLQHQDSIRKLTTTLSALRSKADLSKKTDEELAISMLEAGMTKAMVADLYPDDRRVLKRIEEWEPA